MAAINAPKINAPKGVPDYSPPRSRDFLAVREALSSAGSHAGYDYIELPVFESTELYVRGVGESTDVVSKEMYTFSDRGDRSITLRPEGTAGVMRSVIENRLDKGPLPVKLWYAGPFFRAERPQHGRYRQLQQVGVEAIGSDDPAVDAEVISLAYFAFKSLGLKDFHLDLTSLGCNDCRPHYRIVLQEFLGGLDLDEETQERARINPLRVLDDKREQVQAQLEQVPLMMSHLCENCSEHYARVRAYLEASGVIWQENPRMVRGLDYYTRTTFEFVHHGLGAQSGIGGGGRYDGLMSELGGSELSGIGYGLGVDRTLLACEAEGLTPFHSSIIDLYIIPIGQQAQLPAFSLMSKLRASGLACDMSFDARSMKSAMKNADRSGAPYVALLGDDEVAAGLVTLKSMATGDQERIALDAESIATKVRAATTDVK
ncbi:MAG: histidine--tRNA ligase [Candidatus Nanopelagicales bacterium]